MCTGKCSKVIAVALYVLALVSVVCNIMLFFPGWETVYAEQDADEARLTEEVKYMGGLIGGGIMVSSGFSCFSLCFVLLYLVSTLLLYSTPLLYSALFYFVSFCSELSCFVFFSNVQSCHVCVLFHVELFSLTQLSKQLVVLCCLILNRLPPSLPLPLSLPLFIFLCRPSYITRRGGLC